MAKHDDPDETEGRKLYRARANSLGAAQVNMARRKVAFVDVAAVASRSLPPEQDGKDDRID